METTTSSEDQVALFEFKKQVERLQNFKGVSQTSLISLYVPACTTPAQQQQQLVRVNKLVIQEMSAASHIKSRVNRQAVVESLKHIQQRIKLIPNGLAIFCGNVEVEDGVGISALGSNEPSLEGEEQESAESRTRQLILLEPPRPISQFLYKCDSMFHTEILDAILRECNCSSSVAFIIIDGNGALLATLQGSRQKILWKVSVDLPKKHRRGGQSSVRFARLRVEARHNYLTKVKEVVTKLLTAHYEDNTSTGKLICDAVVIAGNADFKDGLNKLLDPPVKNYVVGLVDVQYGGQQGLYQAIQLSGSMLQNQDFINQRRKFADFFSKIAMDTGKVCYGIEDTLFALESGAVDELLVWESLKTVRYLVKATKQDNTEEKVTVFCLPEENPLEKVLKKNKKLATAKLAIESAVPVLDWILAKHKEFGAHVELVSDETPEGSQFCKGFGGLGAILRYQSNLPSQEEDEDDENVSFDTFDLQDEIDAYLDEAF